MAHVAVHIRKDKSIVVARLTWATRSGGIMRGVLQPGEKDLEAPIVHTSLSSSASLQSLAQDAIEAESTKDRKEARDEKRPS